MELLMLYHCRQSFGGAEANCHTGQDPCRVRPQTGRKEGTRRQEVIFGSLSRVTLTTERAGIRITPDTCTSDSPKSPILGARALTFFPFSMSHPTETQRTALLGLVFARKAQLGLGCALSSHSIMTRGQVVI